MKIIGVTCLCVSRRKAWQQVSTGTLVLALAFSCCFSDLYAQKNQKPPCFLAKARRGGKKQTAIGSYLKSEGIKFSPDFFPILPWDSQHGFRKPFISNRKYGLHSIAECNFTMAGFVRPQDLPLCEKLGLAAIMFGDTGLTRSEEWSELSDEEIDRKIRRMVEQSGNSKAIIGYFITDEPGASAFGALAKAVQAVKKYAPGKLAYINLFPNATVRRSVIAPFGDKDKSQDVRLSSSALSSLPKGSVEALETDSYTEYLEKFAGEIFGDKDKSLLGTDSYTEYLEKFVNEVKPQIISYDNYAVQYSRDLKDSIGAAVYYTNLMEVRRIALKYDLPFWNIVSSNQIRPYTTIP